MKDIPFFFLVLIMTTILFAGCSEQAQPAVQPSPQPTLQRTVITSNGTIGTAGSPYGTILVDSQGKTLYTFADDIPGSGTSSCTGKCPDLWPGISADTTKVTSPLIPSDFGSITRADGSGQTTYHGRPLYYYRLDSRRGDVKGENVRNVWFVVRLGDRIHVSHKDDLGLFLTDGSGKTLYYYTNDTAGMSVCTGKCLTLWPAYSADPVTAPSLLKPADFSTITRADGIKQTAYRGRPLYTFAGDVKPGEVNGQGFGSIWYAANVSGITP